MAPPETPQRGVYLDHAATSPLRDSVRVARAEAPALANPASTHRAGQQASMLLETARERLAAALGAHPTEVVLTSGGTESVNLALHGLATARSGAIVVPEGEHHATLDTAQHLEDAGREVRWVPIDAHARIDDAAFAAALPGAALATAMLVSNEIGTVQPVAALAESAAGHGVPMHVDAVAALGHVPVRFAALGVSALSVSAHKVGGPVGVGVLLVARDTELRPMLHGGGQQRGLRPGTQDVLGAHLASIAIDEAVAEQRQEAERLAALGDRLLQAALAIDGVVATAPAERSPAIVHLAIEGVDAETVQFVLDEAGFAVANGSACTAGVQEPSHVMRAMRLAHLAPLRISMGPSTTAAEIDALASALPAAIAVARRAS